MYSLVIKHKKVEVEWNRKKHLNILEKQTGFMKRKGSSMKLGSAYSTLRNNQRSHT